jgi:hypothetical protein
MTDAFYEPDGARYVSTPWTAGPWDPGAQHGGPPAALTARAIEALEPDGWQVARFTFEILRSIPVAPLTVDARIARPGRRVRFCEATVRTADAEVARASAWQIRRSDQLVPRTPEEPPPFAGPLESPARPGLEREGPWYFSAMDWHYAKGSFLETGPATAWMRMRIPLVSGEEPAPLQRVLCAADSGNGVSREFEPSSHLFINTELTAHLFRMPDGEWVCLDATSRNDATGIGLATTLLYDERGRIGTSNQSLLIAKR